MSDRAISSREWSLLIDALVSYADACTMPQLTPTCPFYERSPDGPRCQEQCRGLSERLGGPERPIKKVAVGGLVMRGRLLPLSAAAGYQPYDARQRFVEERTLDPRGQSTASLLLGLRAALLTPILGETSSQAEGAMSLWAELARRGLPVERIVRGALLPAMSRAIATRAVAPLLVEVGDVPLDISSELRAAIVDSKDSGWSAVLRSATRSWQTNDEMLAAIARERIRLSHQPTERNALDLPPIDEPSTEESTTTDLPEFHLAFSELFRSRIEEWLSRLLEDDLQSVLLAVPPPSSILLALSVRSTARDEIGLWIWERLTRTHLDEWSTSSLLIEWKVSQGANHGTECPPQVLAERRVQSADVSDLALGRISSASGRRAKPEGLNAESLTRSAVMHLRQGRWQAAADVFEGLVALRPADGDAWNNLGFCQLPGDRSLALRSLQQASMYERRDPLINTLNRALALHLLGRDLDSLRISDTALAATNDEHVPAILWHHDGSDPSLVLSEHADPRTFLAELRVHVAVGSCKYAARNPPHAV